MSDGSDPRRLTVKVTEAVAGNGVQDGNGRPGTGGLGTCSSQGIDLPLQYLLHDT